MKNHHLLGVASWLVVGAFVTSAYAGQSQNPSPATPAAPEPEVTCGPVGSGPAAPEGERPPAADATEPAHPKAGSHMFGIMPNYATVEGGYSIDPISARRKFRLAEEGSFDRYMFPFVGVVALFNRNYGGGTKGYLEQYSASFADNSVGNFMTTGVFPSLLHQDPRYYERGQGNPFGRVGYSASRILVTHGDSGHAQFNLSEAAGTAVAATFSNAYYPTAQRTMSGTLSRWGTQLMWDALSNQLKEFWPDVRRRLDRPKRLTP